MPSRVNHNQQFCRNKKNGFRIKSFVANFNKMATIWATMVGANLTKFCKIIRIVMDLVQIYHLSWPWSSRYYNQLKGILCVSVTCWIVVIFWWIFDLWHSAWLCNQKLCLLISWQTVWFWYFSNFPLELMKRKDEREFVIDCSLYCQ